MTCRDFKRPGRCGVRAVVAAAAAMGLAMPAAAAMAWDEGVSDDPSETAQAPGNAAERRARWEGAIGLVVRHSPSYPGAGDFTTKATPAGFIRWGRFTVTGAGGFTTASRDDVERGLGAELVRRQNLQVKLGLRVDNGRQQSDSPTLAGLGDVRATIRARLSARWALDPVWSVTAATSTDIGGRGQGSTAELGVGRDWLLPSDSRLNVAFGVGAADARYMQAWHGVTPAQSAAAGLPVYTPGAGLRGVSLGVQYRREFSTRWTGFVGGAASRLLGVAADSPLTLQPNAWGLQSGVAWRF